MSIFFSTASGLNSITSSAGRKWHGFVVTVAELSAKLLSPTEARLCRATLSSGQKRPPVTINKEAKLKFILSGRALQGPYRFIPSTCLPPICKLFFLLLATFLPVLTI